MAIGVTNKGVNLLSVGEHRINSASCGNTIVYDKINGGGGGAEPDEDALIFTFNITEPNTKINLVCFLENNDIRLDYTCDWGDGSEEDHVIGWDYPLPPHTYTNPGKYKAKIKGDCDFYVYGRMPKEEMQVLADALVSISVSGLSPIHDFMGVFPGETPFDEELAPSILELSSNITSMPLEQMFNNLGDHAATLRGLFAKSHITNKITSTFFQQFDVALAHNLTFDFAYCFAECTNIPAIDENIGDYIGRNYYDDYSYMFQNCTNISGKLPELWLTHGNTIHEGCFRGCVNASNYSEVPSDWK